MKILSSYPNPKSCAVYYEHDGTVGLLLVPAGEMSRLALPENAFPEPMIQVRLQGDDHNSCFTCGLTMRDGQSTRQLRYTGQTLNGNTVETRFSLNENLNLTHYLEMREDGTFRCCTDIDNQGTEKVTVEMLTSFSFGLLSPFTSSPENIRIYRMQSFWSAEGRMKTDDIYSLHLEKAWIPASIRCERFGSVGSMPVSSWFPSRPSRIPKPASCGDSSWNILRPGSWNLP